MGSKDNKRSGGHWQKCLLLGIFLSVAINFYLAATLSGLAEPPPVKHDGRTGMLPSKTKQAGKLPDSAKSLPKGTHYSFDRKLAEDALSAHGHDAIFQPLRAYVEKKLNDTVPGTIDKGKLKDKRPKVEVGKPAKWYVPLPTREGSPEEVSLHAVHVFLSCLILVMFS